jgi:hypothetical protein
MHGDYGFRLGARRLVVPADAFDLFNQQRVSGYDDLSEIQFEIPNANFGRIISYQTPRTVRFGSRFEF